MVRQLKKENTGVSSQSDRVAGLVLLNTYCCAMPMLRSRRYEK